MLSEILYDVTIFNVAPMPSKLPTCIDHSIVLPAIVRIHESLPTVTTTMGYIEFFVPHDLQLCESCKFCELRRVLTIVHWPFDNSVFVNDVRSFVDSGDSSFVWPAVDPPFFFDLDNITNCNEWPCQGYKGWQQLGWELSMTLQHPRHTWMIQQITKKKCWLEA